MESHVALPAQTGKKTLTSLHAFSDNYIWVLQDGLDAWVVDPGEPNCVRDHLDHRGLTLRGILLTHHHADHTGGVDELRRLTGATVYGPAHETLPEPVQRVTEGKSLQVLGTAFQVLQLPGHTSGHIAFYAADFDGLPLLFSGDTLFSGGCGRLLEGTPAQMLSSLDKLSVLPPTTRVCCAHEYTLSNMHFAKQVEPRNSHVESHLRWCESRSRAGESTLPSNIALELKINPFLRIRHPAVRAAVKRLQPETQDDVDIFAALRAWKDVYRG